MTFLLIVLALLIPVTYDLIRRGSFRRLAFRNVVRRKHEATLVILGSMLGTAIIVASFVVGDTIGGSVRDLARTDLGPIDQSITLEDPADAYVLAQDLTEDPIPNTDGAVALTGARAVAASGEGDDRRGAPVAWLAEMDFDNVRAFGADPSITGFESAGATPAGGEALIGSMLAEDLDVGVGDTIEVFAYGQQLNLEVTQVLERVGVAGWADIYLAPGTIGDLAAASTVPDAQPPMGTVLVSNTGGVFDSAVHTEAVADALDTRTSGFAGVEIFEEKRQLLDNAEDSAAEFTELFSGIGSFSVIAGILLLVNLFVMLAEERKSELGMLRAVGLKRNHLVRSFAIEGAFYAVVAAIAGTVLGIGLGWVLVQMVASVFGVAEQGLTLRLTVDADRLAMGAAIGLGISLLTIWFTSVRVARFNVIRAIRELPEARGDTHRWRGLVVGVLGVLGGAALFMLGTSNESAIPLMVGPAIAAFSAIPIVSRFVPPKVARTLLAALALAWGVAVFPVFSDVMSDSDIFTFVVQGVVMVAAAVLIVSSADRVWSWLSDRAAGSRIGIPARLGLAYPLARRFRTGLLLGMYSLVIFTMTFLAAFSAIFTGQTGSFVDEVSAGYEVIVDSSRVNPVTDAALASQRDVAGVATLQRGFAQIQPESSSTEEPEWFPLTGIDSAFVAFGGTTLVDRSTDYASDAEVYAAVVEDPSLAIVNEFLFDGTDGFGSNGFGVGDSFYIVDDEAGTEHALTIVGISGSDIVFNGIYTATSVADTYHSDFVTPRHYVAVAPGAAPGDVAAQLNGALIENGVDARTFVADVNGEIGETVSFLRLLQGFLAVGLVIGIAGLGVVLVRAVRERRRQVGMLRAMGFPSTAVRRAFLLEAAFVAVQGIVIGMALGLVTAYQVIVNSNTFGDTQLNFTMPWVGLAVVAIVPLIASLFAAVAPAARAAAVRPAVALRVAD